MIFNDTITFKLESPDGDAIIKCAELPLDIAHEISAAIRLKKDDTGELIEKYQTAICESVVEISGLEDSKGAITVERVRSKKISPRLLDIITTAFWAAIKATKVTDEKKSDSKTE